jgi:uncharacterized membrane protein YfcA
MLAGLHETLASMGLVQLLTMMLVVIFAAVMRAFTGFGFALAAVPVFSLFMLPTQGVVLSTMLGLAVSFLSLPTYWGKYPLKPLLPMTASTIIGTLLGTVLLTRLSSNTFQLSIGASVILASLVLAFYRPAPQKPKLALTAGTGLASGLMNGAFAIPGPPVIIFAMATQTSPERIRALLMTFFLFSGIIALASYFAAGIVTSTTLWLFLLAFPAIYLGDKLGYYLFGRYGSAMYRRVALVVLLSLGAVITARALLVA